MASWQDFYASVDSFVLDLERSGHQPEAELLREGLRRNTGLTDGHAAFLDAIIGVQRRAAGLSPEQRATLDKIHDTMHYAVHRSRRSRWAVHAAFFAYGTLVWGVFWLLGWPGYYRQYPTWLVAAGAILIAPPLLWLTLKLMRMALPEDPMRGALLMAFYTTVPLAFYDWLYCGIYLARGLRFLLEYWYLTVYYILPWIALPILAHRAERRESSGF